MTTLPRAEYLARLEAFRASASVVVRDPDGRVLMVRTAYREVLDTPGGAVDPGESPGETAVREALEEVGLPVALGRLLCVDHWPARPDNPAAMLHFVFDGGVVAAGTPLALRDGEITGAEWVVPEDVERLGGPRIGRRLGVALRALREDAAFYCEEGVAR